MFKKINNWHLSVLVLIVSFFGISLIVKYVDAQWVDPIGLPGETLGFRLVVNPLVEDLNLQTHSIVDPATNNDFFLNGNNLVTENGSFYGNLCLGPDTNDCISDWSEVAGLGYWQEDDYGISYQDGLVGIGGPSHSGFRLSLYNDYGDILKMSPGVIWAYMTDLELRSSSDVYTNQDFGIGTTNPNPSSLGRKLHIIDETNNAEIDIQSISGSNQHWSIYHDGPSNELRFWRGGHNILSLGTDESVLRGDFFIGTDENYNDLGNDYFFSLDVKSSAPLAGDCSLQSHYGRMIYDYNSDLLYVCDDTGWKSVNIN